MLNTILVSHIDHALSFTQEVHVTVSSIVIVVLVDDLLLGGSQRSAQLIN